VKLSICTNFEFCCIIWSVVLRLPRRALSSSEEKRVWLWASIIIIILFSDVIGWVGAKSATVVFGATSAIKHSLSFHQYNDFRHYNTQTLLNNDTTFRNDHCIKFYQWRHNLFYRSYVFLTSLQLCIISFPLCFHHDQKIRNQEISDLTVIRLFFTFGVFSHWKCRVSWLVLFLECWIMILITFPKAETHLKQEIKQFSCWQGVSLKAPD